MTDPGQDRNEILFEGYVERELLELPLEQIEALFLNGQPIVFHAGSATILGAFKRDLDHLRIDLAHIDGGGEGVLISLGALVKRYTRIHGIKEVEWIVRAVNCDKPNLRLRRVLELRGFTKRDIQGVGEVYYLLEPTGPDDVTHDAGTEAN
jgi:hypothetical protein